MRVLLLMNGAKGSQYGAEIGFTHLLENGEVSDLKVHYYHDVEDFYAKSWDSKIEATIRIADEFKPDLIVISHLGGFHFTDREIRRLKTIPGRPFLVYDEGDMYGGIAKPLKRHHKSTISAVDAVSVRGLGCFRESISRFNSNIVYLPHYDNLSQSVPKRASFSDRSGNLVFVGNRVRSRFGSHIRRLPGARGREKFVRAIGAEFGNEISIYGRGWSGIEGAMGHLPFNRQGEIYSDSRISLAYEHYPRVSYYFSNRLPIALRHGSLYVTHYHPGYENIFGNSEFVFFFQTVNEAKDIVYWLWSLPDEELERRSNAAIDFANRMFSPAAVWRKFIKQIRSMP